jgi:hypothetical protein
MRKEMSTLRKSGTAAQKRTTSAFSSPSQHGPLTRERIAEDLAAFGKAGGKIETLGNTPLRGKVESPKPAPSGRAGKAPAAADGAAGKP